MASLPFGLTPLVSVSLVKSYSTTPLAVRFLRYHRDNYFTKVNDPMLTTEPTLNFSSVVNQQYSFFRTGQTLSLEFRRAQLQKLARLIEQYQDRILQAVSADLRKPAIEAFGSEILVTQGEIKYALRHLSQWIKPKRVGTPFSLFPSASYIYPEPLGVVLIIAPWNYPFALMIQPLVGAIAAGNCAVLKPSEHTPHTAELICEMLNQNFDPCYILAVSGTAETSQALLAEKFDHIFFTGGTAIGKLVMQAAAQHLTPVTLELGGKSPCIVDGDCDLALSAKRIVWGKFYNAGQTCVAPDYLLVDRRVQSALVSQLIACIETFYGADPQASPDYGRIVNHRQFDRLVGLLEQARAEGKILVGGKYDREEKYIAPTLVTEISWEHPLMAEEIFGPILPILTYDTLEEAIALVNSQPKPLALYFFSCDRRKQDLVLQKTSFGGGCINDTIMHLGNPELPFGGVGASGMGRYHGKASFDTFTNYKSVLKNSFRFDFKWRYPPYKLNLADLKKFIG
jgi:aldehyde dehydrogenase (NAD+)